MTSESYKKTKSSRGSSGVLIGGNVERERRGSFIEPREEDNDDDHRPINWIEIIFLPFQLWWNAIIICVVCVKSFVGPMHAVVPGFLVCTDFSSKEVYAIALKVFYMYFCDGIYLFDTFLYILHRQVADEALKREYDPKPGLLIFIDIIALVPLYSLVSDHQCAPPTLWPNILMFGELLCMYRVGKFFRLKTTHNYLSLIVGYGLLLILIGHACVCLLMLVTLDGLCETCNQKTDNTYYKDWRQIERKSLGNMRTSNTSFYFYGSKFVVEMMIHYLTEPIKGVTTTGIIFQTLLMMLSFLIMLFVILPKIFAESLLNLKRKSMYYKRVTQVMTEIKRRNVLNSNYLDVEERYKLIWEKHKGIINVESSIYLPLYLQTEVSQDLVWAVYYHSPTLRRTSMPFKRYLCNFIKVTHKLPGERFFIGPQCYTKTYYLKSGVVQLLSEEDSTAPILSLGGGTVIGDVSFYVPPVHRKVIARCVTYCEVLSVSRKNMIIALHKFPKDLKLIKNLLADRLKHAHELKKIKNELCAGKKSLDRAEHEGLAWLKRRWWEIALIVFDWKYSSHRSRKKCIIPLEEEEYHCVKYIGQLVLCKESNQKKKSLFQRFKFPWIISPNTQLCIVWNRIVFYVVLFTLILYPQNLIKMQIERSDWFIYYSYVIDLIYTIDIFFILITSTQSDQAQHISLRTVAYCRIKQFKFILDVLSTFMFEALTVVILGEEYNTLAKLNRLFKTYRLLYNRNAGYWTKIEDPLGRVCYILIVAFICFAYIVPNFLWVLLVTTKMNRYMTYYFFFGPPCLPSLREKLKGFYPEGETCLLSTTVFDSFEVPLSWMLRMYFAFYKAVTKLDSVFNEIVIATIIFMFFYQKMRVTAGLYMRHIAKSRYQQFVSTLEKYYSNLKIHPDLMIKLHRYLDCQWHYDVGRGSMGARALKSEPAGVYMRLHGENAERVVGGCNAFRNAHPHMVRDIARRAQFLVLPKDSVLISFGVQTDKVMWVIRGVVNCEYHSETGEKLRSTFPYYKILSMGSVFLRRPPLRTYTAASDVEILYLPVMDCFSIIKQYPDEDSFFARCADEITLSFDILFVNYLRKHRDNQRKAREEKRKMSYASIMNMELEEQEKKEAEKKKIEQRESKLYKTRCGRIFANILAFCELQTGKIRYKRINIMILRRLRVPKCLKEYRKDPESKFILVWMAITAFCIPVFVVIRAIDEMIMAGTHSRNIHKFTQDAIFTLFVIKGFDIIIKLFLPYYDHRGLVITSIPKCVIHYGTRGFITDFLYFIFINENFARVLFGHKDESSYHDAILQIVMTTPSFYLLNGFFDYLANSPSARTTGLMILKLHFLVLPFFFLNVSLMYLACIDLKEGKQYVSKKCWAPARFGLKTGQELVEKDLSLIFVSAMQLVHSFLVNVRYDLFQIEKGSLFKYVLMSFASIGWWCMTCYLLSLMLLNRRGSSQLMHDVAQLQDFLQEERVEPPLVQKTMDYFSYIWKRTSGLDMKMMTHGSIGAVFRQELNYYFFKESLKVADTLLRGGDMLQRQLATIATEQHFLTNSDVAREMHLCKYIYIVHRGNIQVSMNGAALSVLSRGSMFGQLDGTVKRPIKITATTVEHADLLVIPIEDFQKVIDEEIRYNIEDIPQSKHDFLPIKKHAIEAPEDTIKFILRRSKTVKFPRREKVMRADESPWFGRWLLLVWFIAPVSSTALTTFNVTWQRTGNTIIWLSAILHTTDLIYVVHFIVDFFTVRFVVDTHNKCVYKYELLRKLKSWRFYFDAISVLYLIVTFISNQSFWQYGRFLRLHSISLYYNQFCKDIKMRTMSIFVKLVLFLLTLHVVACGLIMQFCRNNEKTGGKFPLPMPKNVPEEIKNNIDFSTWKWARQATTTGCVVSSPRYRTEENEYINGYLVANAPFTDYIISISHCVSLLTGTNLKILTQVTDKECLVLLIVVHFFFLLTLWFSSGVISTVYANVREMYRFDYTVDTMLKYMENHGVSKSLQDAVKRYTFLLWGRSKGNEIPTLIHLAPTCLRQDLFSSLFMHHLHSVPVFRAQPQYFLEQVSERMKKVVIFPGKSFVHTGDMFHTIYFIHEGEIERWSVNQNGDEKLMNVLSSNNYFGLIPGLHRTKAYPFTYVTRTVVQLIYLKLDAWSDLMESYPDIKRDIYSRVERPRV